MIHARRTRPVATGLLAGALLALTALPATADVAVAPVVHECGEPVAVCVIGADGSARRVIGATGAAPAVSPDGRQVAYAVAGEGVVVSGLDGSGRRVVATGDLRTPAWSPDGTRLVLAGSREQPGVFVADLLGGSLRRLDGRPAADPSWSPDGSAVAVTLALPELDYFVDTLFVLPLDGGRARELGRATGPAAWSPDGTSIAVGGEFTPRVFPAGGGRARNLRPIPTREERDLRGFTDWTDPAWSPDGTRIAFATTTWVSGPAQTGSAGLALVDAATGRLQQLTSTGGTGLGQLVDRSPRWTPDGTALVFDRARPRDGLFRVQTDGTGLRSLPTTAPVALPDVPSLVTRAAGPTRVATAVSVSRTTRARADAVVVARSDTFPDALAAAPLAASVGGPLLLSPSAGAPGDVTAEVARLGARTAYLVGDETALSAQVETDLRIAGVTDVRRIGGRTRYETAVLIAEQLGGTSVYLASGEQFPDAASVSALAAFQRRPVLLTTAARLPGDTAAALDRLRATTVTVVGGEAAVTPAAAAQAGQGRTLDRLAGADRYATSAAVARRSVAAGLGTGRPWLATGRAFADALAAGPAAAAARDVLLLVDPVSLDRAPAARQWLAETRAARRSVVAVGGPDVVSPGVVTAAVR